MFRITLPDMIQTYVIDLEKLSPYLSYPNALLMDLN